MVDPSLVETMLGFEIQKFYVFRVNHYHSMARSGNLNFQTIYVAMPTPHTHVAIESSSWKGPFCSHFFGDEELGWEICEQMSNDLRNYVPRLSKRDFCLEVHNITTVHLRYELH